jgi:hypothetical protein
VVHAEQLADERLRMQLQVAQGQVALVELAVVDALVDDPRTIARIAGSSRDASERTEPRRRRRA